MLAEGGRAPPELSRVSDGLANLDRTDDSIDSNWTTLVAGNFIGDGRKQALMYDKATGLASELELDGVRSVLAKWQERSVAMR